MLTLSISLGVVLLAGLIAYVSHWHSEQIQAWWASLQWSQCRGQRETERALKAVNAKPLGKRWQAERMRNGR